MESNTKINVDFKPSKKMKKRRELDALVSNNKHSRRKSSSGHELLRSVDSESSDVEDYRLSVSKSYVYSLVFFFFFTPENSSKHSRSWWGWGGGFPENSIAGLGWV